MSFAPYQPPASTSRDARPAVIVWYRAYAAFMAIVYLALALALASTLARNGGDPGAGAFAAHAVHTAHAAGLLEVTVALASMLALLFGGAAFVPFKPWGWTVALVAIALGIASGAVLLALPLLVHWFKPTTKAAFARL